MKSIQSIRKVTLSLSVLFLLSFLGCKKRDIVDLQKVTYPTTAEVFIDDFTSDLAYAAFGGSDVKAFQIDKQVTYGGTSASMRFAVPDANSPQGSYAGGVFFSKTGRDLTGYNALTFYIKASQPVNIGEIGFGNDLGASSYQVSVSNLPANSNWTKVIIPIPDPSKLSAERGLLYYSAAPLNGRGYTFWLDEVKFEYVSEIAHTSASILNGANKVLTSYIGVTNKIDGLTASFNLPSGINLSVNLSPYYFTFKSSDSSIAKVNAAGVVSTVGTGTVVITGKLGSLAAAGSLTLNSRGNFVHAPVPTADPARVISVFSDAYSNVPVDYYNGYWAPYQTTQSADFAVTGDHVLNYTNFNFVGIQFSNPTINASQMRFLHVDLYVPNALPPGASIQVQVVDFGANGVFGGGDDVTGSTTINAPTLISQNWVSLNIPFSALNGLTTKGHLAQVIFVGSNLSSFYADNIYFYYNPVTPLQAAPTPTAAAANVLSIFSDSYTNVAGTDFFPNWGQTTVVTQIPIAGNNTLHYANFNYEGAQLGSNQNVSSYGFLHLDYYSANASQLRVFLISPGPVETPYTLSVPTSGWNSVNIPLSAFSPVALNNIFQMKFDLGSGDDIFLDNIYFWKIPPVPPVPAPTPVYPPATVISIFSDAYTNVAGTDFFPNWGQNTVVTQVPISGNNTLLYTGLNYEGTQLGSNQNVSSKNFLHVDYYSANSSALQVFLISPGPVQTSYTLPVPTANGWNSVDIPLTAFAPVDLTNVFQLMFVGNGNIYIDNIVFHQ